MTSSLMRARRAVGMAVLGLFGAGGCALILGIDDKPLAGAPDAAPALDPTDPCNRVGGPDPPDGGDPAEQVFWFAMRTVDVIPADGGGPLGFNLDRTCTCGAPRGPSVNVGPSCVPPADAGPLDAGLCDQAGGIDNALSSVGFLQYADVLPGNRHADINCGRTTIFGVIAGYNGLADDPSVQFSVVLSAGLDQPHDDAEAPSSCNDAGPDLPIVYNPRWDGTDRWSADVRFVTSPKSNTPKVLLKGWVRNWQLFAHADPTERVTVPFGPILFEATDVTVLAPLAPLAPDAGTLDPSVPGTRASLVRVPEGQFGGRATVATVLRAVSSIGIRQIGYLCPGNVEYEQVKNDLCALRDVVTDPSKDFSDQTCDGVTAAARFQAEPAILTPATRTIDAGSSPCPTIPDDVCGP